MIQRRTPMKRTPWNRKPAAPMKRTRLRPCSAKKAAWKRKYAVALAAAKKAQLEAMGFTWCQRCRAPAEVDGHHPGGQNGERIMVFRLVCRPCHDWIHFTDPNAARAEGWLE